MGLIGCGRIGQKLSELAVGFNMETIEHDPIVKVSSRIKLVTKEEVLSQADYVSIHVNGN